MASETKTEQVPAHSASNAGRFLTVGVTPEYLQLRNLPVEKGRAISAADVRELRRVAVLGASVRKQLFEKKPVPLGETIYLKNYPYEVIGLMSEKDQNSSYDGWDNDKILVPEPGEKLLDGEKEAGEITSAAWSPAVSYTHLDVYKRQL